jgi:hypothetical protein
MRRNKVKNKLSAWKNQTAGAKVARGSLPNYNYSSWSDEWYPRTKFNKTQKVRRYMKSPKYFRSSYGKLVTSAAKWRDELICQVHKTLRQQSKKEVHEELQSLLEDEKREAEEALFVIRAYAVSLMGNRRTISIWKYETARDADQWMKYHWEWQRWYSLEYTITHKSRVYSRDEFVATFLYDGWDWEEKAEYDSDYWEEHDYEVKRDQEMLKWLDRSA